MSSQLLYQIFRVAGYSLTKTEVDSHRVLLHVAPQPHRICCPVCGGKKVIRRGKTKRWFRNLPVGSDCSWVIATLPRVECRDCQLVRQIDHGLADEKRTYTRAFERYVLDLSQYMIPQDIARHLGVSWDIVKDIQLRNLRRRYAKPKLKQVRHIAIDEIHIGRQGYLTLVLDLDSGAIVHVGQGKKAASLSSFWRRLRASGAKVQAVATDMSRAYIGAVEKNLPDAALVFDRFHIVKLMNEKLTELRRELHREVTDVLRKQVLKGTRWLLLKNPENLDPAKREPQRLREALKLNEPLATAYYLKEDLRQIWEQLGKWAAKMKLLDWYHQAMASGVRVLQDFARLLLAHQDRILAWYDYPISTGPLEGTNNKIRTLQRQHYGLRDKEFFQLKGSSD